MGLMYNIFLIKICEYHKYDCFKCTSYNCLISKFDYMDYYNKFCIKFNK